LAAILAGENVLDSRLRGNDGIFSAFAGMTGETWGIALPKVGEARIVITGQGFQPGGRVAKQPSVGLSFVRKVVTFGSVKVARITVPMHGTRDVSSDVLSSIERQTGIKLK
jgi:hypothetical protein